LLVQSIVAPSIIIPIIIPPALPFPPPFPIIIIFMLSQPVMPLITFMPFIPFIPFMPFPPLILRVPRSSRPSTATWRWRSSAAMYAQGAFMVLSLRACCWWGEGGTFLAFYGLAMGVPNCEHPIVPVPECLLGRCLGLLMKAHRWDIFDASSTCVLRGSTTWPYKNPVLSTQW
jgi:hypothetical protein